MGEAKPEGERFKPRLSLLFPVVLSLSVTGLLGYPFRVNSFVSTPVVIFQGGTITDASLNALYFVVALAITATAMLFLVRRGKMGVLRNLVKVAVIIVCFTVALWYSSEVYSISGIALDNTLGTSLILASSLATAVVLGLFVFGKAKTRQLAGVVLLSALTGVFLGSNIDVLTALVLAGALVVYDIVAVFRGPVGALAKSMEAGDLPGAMFNYQELSIGMGDMVFYSLLAMTAMLFGGLASFVGAAIGIVAGTFLGFKALQRFEMFPGLPFSLVLGIAGMFLGQLVSVILSGGTF